MSTFAQLILKVGANKIRADGLTEKVDLSSISYVLSYFNIYILLGLAIYVVSAANWIWVLTRVEISAAYPFISLGFIMTLAAGVGVFGETLSFGKVFGTALIVVGCVFVARA
ncbi:EamA family transporter [Arenicella xantha]|nr:EamA family transporter [Arenicella xantha]